MGRRQRYGRTVNELEAVFPGLRSSKYARTSPPDWRYNCIAWAAGDSSTVWWPDSLEQAYWPEEAPRRVTLDAFAKAYSLLGYEVCDTHDNERGFEKVAIFVDPDDQPKHGARQLLSGKWTSKLGKSIDIEHDLNAVEGAEYGSVALIMKRPVRD